MAQLTEIAVYLLASLHIVLAAVSVYHILLYKRDTRSATGWIMACIFIPYGGPVSYYLFGINRVRTRARGIRRPFFRVRFEAGQSSTAPSIELARGLESVGQRITGRMLSEANAVDVYHNGEEAYPAMLESIVNARRRIFLATYILKTDRTGTAFADALGDAVGRGVDVRVLVDGIGELYSRPKPSRFLRRRGISVGRFLPPRLLPPSVYLNLRNHRKLLVVDNSVAYAGGMNISDEHTSVNGARRSVTDVHFGFRGPIISDLAAVFDHDWQFTTGQDTATEEDPVPPMDADARCRVIPDGPDDRLDALALTIQGVIGAAADTVDIMTPYFLPSRELMASMQAAALRGVQVRVVLPGKNNLFFVHWANRNVLAELLEWGIDAYYQPAPFCHSKLLCVDDQYCLVGSANLDPRSLRLNFELGVEILCAALNADLRAHIDQVIAVSEPITLHALASRSTPVRLRDSLVSLLSPYL